MASTPASTVSPAARTAWQEFRDRRERSLAAPHGVLAQVALHWVDPDADEHTVDGLPGRWRIADEQLQVSWGREDLDLLADAPDVEHSIEGTEHQATLRTDGDVRLARFGQDVEIDVIRRGGRTGLRVLDPSAPRRTGFTGVPTYPADPAFVVTGTWRAQPTEVTVGSALPWLEHHLPSPGVVSLDIGGQRVELMLTGESSLLFTDETSTTTSADWRVVDVELEGDRARVDFHRAVNFPAAFSTWATCPRPPSGNHLPLEIRAGEKRVRRTER